MHRQRVTIVGTWPTPARSASRIQAPVSGLNTRRPGRSARAKRGKSFDWKAKKEVCPLQRNREWAYIPIWGFGPQLADCKLAVPGALLAPSELGSKKEEAHSRGTESGLISPWGFEPQLAD